MILALCGQKGGAGKTTIATNVIPELLARGRRVLLIDADVQGSAKTWAHKAAQAGLPAPVIALVDGIPLESDGRYDEGAVAAWLKNVRRLQQQEGFDDVVIDCPGRLTSGQSVQSAALHVSDIALVPTAEDAFSAWALAATADLIRTVQARQPGLHAFGLVAGVDRRRLIGEQARQHIKAAGLQALKAQILDRAEYVEAPGFLKGASTYKPSSAAAAEVRALVDELLNVWRGNGEEAASKRRARAAAGADVHHKRRGRSKGAG